MSLSSPKLADLDGDGTRDIVFGSGVDRLQRLDDGTWAFGDQPEVPGHVTAVSGRTNEVLWRAPHPGEAYTTPRFADLDGDGVEDVVMGGREGAFAAYDGADGSVLWRVPPEAVAATPVPYNFSTPAFVGDRDGDGVPDLLVCYGGDATRQPGEPRDPGYLALVSGADGRVLAARQTPDGAETYASPVVYRRGDGTLWAVFGTGGETLPGAAWRAPVRSILNGGFADRVERLTEPETKGVMAPATLVDVNGDEEPDLAISTFDGRLVMVDGSSGRPLWEERAPGEESYQPAAVARISADGRLGLAVSRGVGAFPAYTGSVHRLLDARTGEVVWQYRSPRFPAGAPLAVDLTGDGIDEVFLFSDPGRIQILHLPTRDLLHHDLGGGMSFSATPLIADPRGAGGLELIGVAWRNTGQTAPGAMDWRAVRLELLRLDLGAPGPGTPSWAGYMGTDTDGQFPPGGTGPAQSGG